MYLTIIAWSIVCLEKYTVVVLHPFLLNFLLEHQVMCYDTLTSCILREFQEHYFKYALHANLYTCEDMLCNTTHDIKGAI